MSRALHPVPHSAVLRARGPSGPLRSALRWGGPLLAPLLFAACATTSTEADVGAVESLVEGRQLLALDLDLRPVERGPEPDGDPEVERMLKDPLTLENAIRVALLNNRELRAALLDLGVARGQLAQASLFPNLDFEAEVRVPEGSDSSLQWDFGLGVDLTQVILRGQHIGVAESELEAARLRAAGATLDLAYRVRLAFLEVQAAQQELELQKTALGAFAASAETAEVLHAAGNLTDLDLATEQAAFEAARVAVAEAEAAWVDAREALNVQLGLSARAEEWTIAARLPDPVDLGAVQGVEAKALEASLELAETRARIEAALRRVGVTETSAWLPDLNLGFHAEHDGEAWEMGPALNGRLPLFDRQQGNIASLRAELEALRERYVQSAVELRAWVRKIRTRALNAEARARQYRDSVLPLRARVLDETTRQYNAMQVGVFQLLQARRDQIEAGRAYVSTLLEYGQARAALEQLLAGRSVSGSAAPNARARSAMPSGGASGGH